MKKLLLCFKVLSYFSHPLLFVRFMWELVSDVDVDVCSPRDPCGRKWAFRAWWWKWGVIQASQGGHSNMPLASANLLPRCSFGKWASRKQKYMLQKFNLNVSSIKPNPHGFKNKQKPFCCSMALAWVNHSS